MLRYVFFIQIIVIVACFGMNSVNAQIDNTEPGSYIEEVMESITERGIDPDDVHDLANDLGFFRQHPLNINDVQPEELKSLYILSDYQIAALIDYRENNGPFLSLYELLYIPGFRDEDLRLLQYIMACEKPCNTKISLVRLLKYPQHEITLRYQQILEKQEGYKKIPDSVLQGNSEKTRYLGSPARLYCRYMFSSRNNLSLGLIAEKDPGEEFFTGSNRQGFDYYSAYVAYADKKRLIQYMLLGDYHIRIGQGVLGWSTYGIGKTSYVSSISKSASIFHPNNSADENRFLRGAAFTLGNSRFSFSSFASRNEIDASVTIDSLDGNASYTGLAETGYHATPLDIRKEDAMLLTVCGAMLRADFMHIKLGLNGLYSAFNMKGGEVDRLYNNFQFRGRILKGMSVDYRFCFSKFQFSGETSCSNAHFASLNTFMFFLTPEITLGTLHRHYDKEYYSYYANAFRENSTVNNEDGFYLGTEMRYSKSWLMLYADVFSFPWLKYTVNTPSSGYEVFLEYGIKMNTSEICFRLESLEKPENKNVNVTLYEVQPKTRRRFRINSKVPVGTRLLFQNRLEMTYAAYSNNPGFVGYYLAQDFILQKLKLPLELTLRFACFNAENYDTRIYAYERDIHSAGSSQIYYGKGWRLMLLLNWNITEQISLRLKITRFNYPGEKLIGSGLTAIESHHRTEVKFQLNFRL
jgi:hypothetical protein